MANFLEGQTLGERIKALRISKGLSQQDVSVKSGVSQQVISVIETRGGGTHPAKLVKLAEALGCDVKQLLPEDRVKRSARNSGVPPSKTDKSFNELMGELQDALEVKIGFRPTSYQALKYIIKKADPANELGLMESVDERRPVYPGMSR